MSKREGKKMIADAAKAGEKYASDQVDGDYFKDWVWDQMVEADKMRRDDPNSVIPLETKSDYRKLAKNMLETLEYDTKRDLDSHTILDLSGAAGLFRGSGEGWVQKKYGVTLSDLTDAFYEAFDKRLSDKNLIDWIADMAKEMNEELGEHAAREAVQRRPPPRRPAQRPAGRLAPLAPVPQAHRRPMAREGLRTSRLDGRLRARRR